MSKNPSDIIFSRKLIMKKGYKLENIFRCSRYALGCIACFAIVGLYFHELGFISIFIGFFGVILLERSIFVLSGMQTK